MMLLQAVLLFAQIMPQASPSDHGASSTDTAASAVRYVIWLTKDESLLLQQAAEHGVGRYGGDAQYHVRLDRSRAGVRYIITIEQPKLIEVWSQWAAEQTTTILAQVNIGDLNDGAKRALTLTQSVNAKLQAAGNNPIWEPKTLVGTLLGAPDSGELLLESGHRVKLRTDRRLDRFAGEVVVVHGPMKEAGVMELLRVTEHRPQTLQMVVMSLCPFARRAEDDIIGRMTASEAPPEWRLDVRYLFYRSGADGATPGWRSLHGEPEVVENLVQMVIRDRYPSDFLPYLRLRATRDDPWEMLAAVVGLDSGAIRAIREAIATERDSLIEAEHRFVTTELGVTDGSPTFLWEGNSVTDRGAVPPLAELRTDGTVCGSESEVIHGVKQ